MKLFGFILFFVMITSAFRCSSQTVKSVDTLEATYQSCLDKGVNMLQCSETYYKRIDSMMNVIYTKIQIKMSPSERAKLKAEQKEWLIKRDKYFKSIKLEPEELALPIDDQEMVSIDRKASFVKERVLEMINKYAKY